MESVYTVRPSVKLTELFPPEAIRVGLQHQTRSAVIEDLVHHAVRLGYLRLQEERPIIDTLLAREDLSSTAMGHGLAVPHCQWRSLDRSVGVVGLLHRGIPFDPVRGGPVDKVFLTLTPPTPHVQIIDLLGRLVAISRNQSLCLLLRGCRTVEQVAAILDELDQPSDGSLDDLTRLSLTRRDPEPWGDLADFALMRPDHSTRARGGSNSPFPPWL